MNDYIPSNDLWHIIITQPNCEARAASGLIGRRYRAYAPIITKTIAGIDVPRPMFPGYIFAIIQDLNFIRARTVPGVRDFLRVAGTPMALPPLAIDAVAAKEAEQEELRRAAMGRRNAKAHDFVPGQTVRIVSGPFADHLIGIERLDGESRIRVFIDLFGRPTPVSLCASEIEAA